MATVRLEFDLDSDVYPELYAALSGLRTKQARTERMRQLAASGLVWENVRIYGAAAIGQNLSAESPPPPAVAQAAPPPKAERAVKPERPAKDARPRALPTERPGKASRGTDFVDLAIDAEPSPLPPVTAKPRDPRISQRDVDQVARELPVLMDVVTETEVHGDAGEGRGAPLYVVPSPNPARAPQEPPRQAAEERHGEEAREESAASDDAIHMTALAQKPAHRSRLLRMKEKGLFKNG